MNEVFERFASYLHDRFERGTFTTEDSVRYTLFHALSETISPAQIVVEAPHPTISGKRVDLVAPVGSDGALLAIEFKYDRRAKMNAPMPMKAGALIHDFVRMAALPEQYRLRYVVYVTDDEMHGYFERSALRTKMGFYGASMALYLELNASLTPHSFPNNQPHCATVPPLRKASASQSSTPRACPRITTCGFSRLLSHQTSERECESSRMHRPI